MAGRIPESIDFEQVNRDVDDLIQGAVADLLKGGGSGSASGRTSIPSFQRTNTDELRGEVNRVKDTRKTTNQVLDDEQRDFERSSVNKTDAIAARGAAEASLIAANAARAADEAKIYRDLAESLGVDIKSIAEVANRIKLERPKAEAMLTEIQEMQSVGLLDNPLEWFVNQIQLPAKTEPYNRQADRINMLQASLDTGLKTAQDAAAHNTKGIPAITAAQAVAGADVVVQKAAQEKAAAEQELSRQNVTFATQKLANDLNVANLTKEMTQVEISQNLHTYQAKIAAIQIADNDATRKIKAAELLEKLERTKGLDVMLENYDRIMGHPKGTTNRYTFERFGKDQAVNIISIGAGTAGATPYQAMINFSQARPGPEIAPDTLRMYQYLQNWGATIASTPDVQRLDEKQKEGIISKKLQEQVDLDLARASTMGSIFYEMPPAAMLGSGKIPQESRLFKVLEPLTKQTGPIPTEAIIETIRKEYPNPAEAGQVIAEYYRRNVELRNLSMNARSFGIKIPGNYKVTAQGLSMFNKPTFDLTRPEEATKYLLFNDLQKNMGEALRGVMGRKGG